MFKAKTPSKTRQTYKFIESHCDEFNVATMCRVLGVARAGYYKWLGNPVSDRAHEGTRLLKLIRASFIASHGIYGAPRILQDLHEHGETCSKHRVARLMSFFEINATKSKYMRRIASAPT
jgi:putative transposase